MRPTPTEAHPENYRSIFPKTYSLRLPEGRGAASIYTELGLQIILNPIEEDLKSLPNCAASKVAFEMSREFLANSIDSGATELTISIDEQDDFMHIYFTDNGSTELPQDKVGEYNILRALNSESPKKAMENQIGGKNLGLVLSALFLKEHGGESGALCLVPNATLNPSPNNAIGTSVILKSSTQAIADRISVSPNAINVAHNAVFYLHRNGDITDDEKETLLKRHEHKLVDIKKKLSAFSENSGDGRAIAAAISGDTIGTATSSSGPQFFSPPNSTEGGNSPSPTTRTPGPRKKKIPPPLVPSLRERQSSHTKTTSPSTQQQPSSSH